MTPSDSTAYVQRRWLFRALMGSIPIIAIVFIELSLRAGGYGEEFSLFVPVPGQEGYLMPNPGLGRLYFVGERPPNIFADYFPRARGERDIRLFVQGASTAAGFPFYYGGTFPHILENRIRRAFPDRSVDVVNTAMAAVNSYTLLDLAPEIARREPDAVLIYAGHNEYYGALGVASTEHLSGGRPLVRLYLRLLRFRIAQLLRTLAARTAALLGGRAHVPEAGRMEFLARDRSIPFGGALYREGADQFRENLTALLAYYRRRDIPVFVATLASNLRDQSPFVGGKQAGATQEEDLADDLYQQGRELDLQERFAEARRAYLRAKDLDRLRFRAPEEFNEVIREAASMHGAVLVDVQAALAAAAFDGIIGADLMTDHLHPNVDGYHKMADAYFDAMIAEDVIGAPPKESVSSAEDVVLTKVDSLVGMYHVAALTSRWPFRYADGELRLPTPSGPVEALAHEVFLGRMTWEAANRRLIGHQMRTGNLGAALRASRSRLQELPFLGETYLITARLLMERGDIEEAAKTLNQGLLVEETWQGHAMLASALERAGQMDQSRRHLARAGELRREEH